MKKNAWLMVANSSLARIFKIESKDVLTEVTVLEHPESRLRNLDLVSDKPGREFESATLGRHALSTGTTPKKHEFAVFAKLLADYLAAAQQKNEFEFLYIAANPSLLGLLRAALDSTTKKAISGEIDKDFTHLKAQEILAHLPFI